MGVYYLVNKGAQVRVADRKGVLYEHVLKDKMEFWSGFDKAKKGARQVLVGETHLDPIGSIGSTLYNLTFYVPSGDGNTPTKISAQHLAEQGEVTFTTGHEEWPHMVVHSDWVKTMYDSPFDVAAFRNCPKGVGE